MGSRKSELFKVLLYFTVHNVEFAPYLLWHARRRAARNAKACNPTLTRSPRLLTTILRNHTSAQCRDNAQVSRRMMRYPETPFLIIIQIEKSSPYRQANAAIAVRLEFFSQYEFQPQRLTLTYHSWKPILAAAMPRTRD